MSPSEPTGRFTRATGAALAGLLLVPATAIAAVAIVGVTSSVPEETGRQLETPIALESEESSDHSSDADDNDGSSTSITIQGDENDDDGSVTSTTLDDDD
ncbi:MAG: hypothetical protein M3112_01125, partial [Actinomycetia bacterium]|nr:hypothetical protein [Actinomycetes bacterium]